MKILGISAFYHDSAAAILDDGRIVAAAQEERFTRIKHDPRFPEQAINYVLKEANSTLNDVDYVAFYDKPLLKFERLLETYIATAPKGFNSFRMAMPIWLREKLFLKDYLLKQFNLHSPSVKPEQLMFSEHHFSHAASAFYPSPFDQAVVLTLDGVGEWSTTTVATGDRNALSIKKELHFPHSLGLLYSAFTYYLGFKVNSGEYKVMGLAPYGNPVYLDKILDNIIDVKDDGSFRLDQSYFDYISGLHMTNDKFSNLFGQPVRERETADLLQFHMDVAASVQAATEEIVIRMTRNLAKEYAIPNLCMAGGVALNCVANGKIHRDGAFENIWVQPAAGDAGGALGAALALWHSEFGKPRETQASDSMSGSYLGPCYSNDEIEQELTSLDAVFAKLPEDEMVNRVAEALSESKAVGWFQGRMEFGPRALGARSILGDARSASTQKTLNLKVKYRESFRPFAPSALREDVSDWFDFNADSPYMLLVADVKEDLRQPATEEEKLLFGIDRLNIKRSEIPAVTHVDYSARIQTVHNETNPRYYKLINRFKKLTGCPVIVNTSFNIRGEPIVSSPTDAYKCFMGTELDVLAIGGFLLIKEDQKNPVGYNYKDSYELD